MKARSRNHCYCGKAISITYSKSMTVAIVTQHATRMCHIILSSVTCLALPYFSTLSDKRHDCRKNAIKHKICVLICPTTFVLNHFSFWEGFSHYLQRDKVNTGKARTHGHALSVKQTSQSQRLAAGDIMRALWSANGHLNEPNHSQRTFAAASLLVLITRITLKSDVITTTQPAFRSV
jgi:hypothetical protein